MSRRFTQFDVDLHHARMAKKEPVAMTQTGPERILHACILAECWRRGWPVVHARMDRPATVAIGTPDFVIAMPTGRTLWIEAKASKTKVSQEQLAWIASLKRQGHFAYIVRSLFEFQSIIKKHSNEDSKA